VTGASRAAGIGAAIAARLASDGFDVAATHWMAYDGVVHGEDSSEDVRRLGEVLRGRGAATCAVDADLSDPATPARVFDEVEAALGPVSALIASHCHDVESSILDTTVESFDLHANVNARATWLLIREFATRFVGTPGSGRIICLTSDHTAGNLPYGASKGALDRITIAAAREFAGRGITANAINPGPTDTGWMTPEQLALSAARSPLGRAGTAQDCANLVSFLCSAEGGWINGQLLHSDGGRR
jgi:3-oxoacyl-[acyl-carrier protein] reductase